MTGKLVQQKDESMGTAFFHTTSNLLTLLSLSPPFDKEGGEMVGIRRIFFLVFSWTKRRASTGPDATIGIRSIGCLYPEIRFGGLVGPS